MSRRIPTRAAPPSANELAGLIDQALDLLSAYDAGAPPMDEADAKPLPSLLAQCQMLVDRSDTEVPVLRAAVSFGPLDRATERLLEAQANLVLLYGLAAPAAAGGGSSLYPAIPDGDRHRAQRAALHSLVPDLNRTGLRLVVALDALRGEADLLMDQMIPGLILTCHPLRSYLLARHRGLLPLELATLEAYAEGCLQILDRLLALPHLRLEALSNEASAGEVETALSEFCAALRLPLALDPLALELPAMDPAPTGVLLFADGSPATEARLDTPAYLELCQRLGYAPDRMPEASIAPQAGGMAPPPVLALPARRADRSPSRLGAVLPRIAAALDPAASRYPAPFRLDLQGLVARIENCLDHPDGTLEAIDACVHALPLRDGTLVQIACAAHLQAVGDTLLAQSLLAEAEPLLASGDRPLRLLTAELLLKLGKAEIALEVLLADAFGGAEALSPATESTLRATLDRLKSKKALEHGHALLLAHLEAHPPAQDGRRRVMIEIGTTRETVPGQGSTEKLAIRCAELGIDFITVDMDPRNGKLARRMFRRHGFPFQAATAKGEDFLAEWPSYIDYCFLDAYDFDHGNHSELRQSRYESFLGSRITDEACHQMHFDCATNLIEKLAPGGVICFDDTWTDAEGAWIAKGTKAMPLLLENGFRVLEARNRAALLARDRPP